MFLYPSNEQFDSERPDTFGGGGERKYGMSGLFDKLRKAFDYTYDDDDDWEDSLYDEDEDETASDTETEEAEETPPRQYNARAIGFMSGKGGVGKTGLAINMANFCAENGARVLLLDCDLGTNGATMFFSMDAGINRKLHKSDDVLSFQDILDDLLNEIALGVQANSDNYAPVIIKDGYEFIPAGIGGSVLDEQELTDELLMKLEKKLESLLSGWRKEFDLIILDFGAGAGRLNSLLAKVVDNICIVMHPDKISRQAVRSKLGFLFREHDLEDILCCINMVGDRKASPEGGTLMNEFTGFKYSGAYADLFEKGEMIAFSDNALCDQLVKIVRRLYPDGDLVMEEYNKKMKIRQNEYSEMKRMDELMQEENRLFRRTMIGIALFPAVICSAILIVNFMKAWDKIPVSVYVVFICGLIFAEWLIIGRGELYKKFVGFIAEITGRG